MKWSHTSGKVLVKISSWGWEQTVDSKRRVKSRNKCHFKWCAAEVMPESNSE